MKTYLITGCAGFIGSNFVHYMLKKYPEILLVNLDKLTYAGNLENLKDVEGDPRHVFVQGDICDEALIEELFTEHDIRGVIHFAAYSLVGESMTNPFKYYDNNMSGTNVLLKAMEDCGVKNIVFSSTAATYGEAQNIPILETDPTNPTNVYGETKLAMERMINWYHKAHDTNYVSLRYFNVAGAHESGLICLLYTSPSPRD